MPTIITPPSAVSDLTSGRLQIDIHGKILLLDPNETPATFILERLPSRKAKQPTVSFDTDEYRPDKDQVDGSHLVGDTAITVDNGEYFQIGDLWRVHDSLEIMYIVGVVGNVLTVIRNFPGAGSGTTGAPTALQDNDWLLLHGNVSGEGTNSPEPVMTQEVQHNNYCEITKTPFELTETEIESLYNTEAPLPYNVLKYAREHMFARERKIIYGLPSATQQASNGKLIRTMGGFNYWINENAPSGNVISQADLTQVEFLEAIRIAFRYGSGTKFMFACPLIMSAIEFWGLAKFESHVGDNEFGLNIQRWVSPHGMLHLINHKMLEGPDPGTIGGWAFIIDLEEPELPALRPTRFLTNIQANDSDTRKNQYLSEETLIPGHFSKHVIIKDVTSFS